METISVKDLKKKIDSLDPIAKNKTYQMLAEMGIDLSQRNDTLTGTKVFGFILEKQIYRADSHKSVFLQLTELVLKRFPQREQDKILKIKGRKKKYFSKTPKDFSHFYEKIPGTEFYADTNENAVQLNRRCQKTLTLFGIDPVSFEILLY